MLEAFKSLLSTLAPALGLPEITIQEEDPVSLLGIDDFEVSLRYLPDAALVMIFTVVAPLPENGRETLYPALLDANTFFHNTQGFTLAAREDTGVTLQGVQSLSVLDSSNIATWVQNFVNVADHWQQFCLDSESGVAPMPEEIPILPQDMLRV